MSYEILKDDVKHKSSSGGSKGDKKKKNFLKDKLKIKPMYIHIIVIIIVLILLGIYIFNNFDFKFKDSKDGEELTTIVGKLKQFNETYRGNLNIYSSEFMLKTPSGKFNAESKDIAIKNFSGNILHKNHSIILDGIADKIEFGANQLNLDGGSFVLNSTKKTTMDLYFNNLNLNYEKGRIKLNDDLNYQFANSTIMLQNYNFSFSYDGTFSFQGKTGNFKLLTSNPHITISYENKDYFQNVSSS